MKTRLLLFLMLFGCLANRLTAQTYCLTYRVARVGGALEVTLGLKASDVAFKLGASNLQFKYKSAVVGNPVLVSNALSATGKYNGITLTTPTPLSFAGTGDSLVSFNFNFTGTFGAGFPISLAGTEVAVIRFQIKSGLSPLFRPYDHGSAGTIVYNDDPNTPMLLQTAGSCPIYDVLLPTESPLESRVLKVFPNPVQSVLNLETVENQSFQIINLVGQVVLRGKAQSQIDVSMLPIGSYILKVGAAQTPFIKQ
jgi:hypothetical protein